MSIKLLLRRLPGYGFAPRSYYEWRFREGRPQPVSYGPSVEHGVMNPALAIIERLLKEKPRLHHMTEETAREVAARTGIACEAGPTSWAVHPAVLHYFAKVVKPTDRTAETGGGHSTVALAALAAHHTCVTNDAPSAALVGAYLESLGIADRATIIVDGSDVALPKLPDEEKFDFAYVDGSHAYPLPAIDWHFLDLHLKIGGLMGFDNVEIPGVQAHCEFLRLNGSYRLVHKLTFSRSNYTVCVFEKLRDEPRWDLAQPFCRRRVSRNGVLDSLKTTLYGWLGREGKPYPWE